MVDEYCDQTNLRLTHCTDPYFTSDLILPYRDTQTNGTYLAQVGMQKEERLVYTALHHGGRGSDDGVLCHLAGRRKAGP